MEREPEGLCESGGRAADARGRGRAGKGTDGIGDVGRVPGLSTHPCAQTSVEPWPVSVWGTLVGLGAAWGQAGACFGMAISDTSVSPPALSPDTGFPKPNHWETQQLLLDRPLPPLSWEGLDLAERLPRGLAPVSAWGAMGVGMGAPQGPSCCDTGSSCSPGFWLSSWSAGSCAVLRGNSIMSQSCSSGSRWICQKEATQL